MLINLRNALMGGKRTPTAKDYIQNGLIAMWDGIENAGWGVHDPNATTWKDLVGDVVATLTRGHSGSGMNPDMYWDDDALVYPGTLATAQFDLPTIGTDTTIEVAYSDFQKVSKFFGLFDTFDDTVNFYKQNGNLTDRVGFAVYNVRPGAFLAPISALSSDGDAGSISMFFSPGSVGLRTSHNDERTAIIGNYSPSAKRWGIGGPYSTNFWTGKIHGFRMYNRVLTASEIAANYAIDSARYGLP